MFDRNGCEEASPPAWPLRSLFLFTESDCMNQRLSVTELSTHLLDQWINEVSHASHEPRTFLEERSIENIEALGFSNWAESLVRLIGPRFREAIAPNVAGRDGLLGTVEQLEAVWLPVLAQRLSALVARTFTLELHVAHLQNQLVGDTPQERRLCFFQRLHQPDVVLALLREYPVLAKKIALCAAQWHQAGVELVERLTSDWDSVAQRFFPAQAPGLIIHIDGSAGDQHYDGRCVLILHFASGERLVYKPRSLAIEARFAELIEWLNARGAEPALRPLDVLDRGTYGWAEYVAVATCRSPAEVRRFYVRQGMYLALLSTLAATDFHFENVIAYGEFPVFIDLEALLHRRPPGGSQDPARQGLAHSVMRVRLLPQIQYAKDEDEGVDYSGLGAEGGVGGAKHRPRLPDAEVCLADYQPAVTEGFRRMYDLLLQRRDALLAPTGPIAAFGDCQIRLLARATQAYSSLIQQSLHPDNLRSEAEQTQIWDRLQTHAGQLTGLQRLIVAESEDLSPVIFRSLRRAPVRGISGPVAASGLPIILKRQLSMWCASVSSAWTPMIWLGKPG
jgi:lantibiotic modifying enzyme